jgi:hypothetical protein
LTPVKATLRNPPHHENTERRAVWAGSPSGALTTSGKRLQRNQFQRSCDSLRCIVADWILHNLVHLFPKSSFQRRAFRRAHKAYIAAVNAHERDLGGFDP